MAEEETTEVAVARGVAGEATAATATEVGARQGTACS